MNDSEKQLSEPILACQNCHRQGPENAFAPAKDIAQRHELGDPYSNLECPDCGALAYPIQTLCTTDWNNDDCQFARLLVEVNASQSLDISALADAMSISEDRVHTLFERAETTFQLHLVNLARESLARSR